MTCPKCGGDTGYIYKLIIAYQQWKQWDGEPVQAEQIYDSIENKTGKTGECLDCGHKFRISKLTQSPTGTKE